MKHSEIYKTFKDKIAQAGLAELHALEKKLTMMFDHGYLSTRELMVLDVAIMEEIARFDCIEYKQQEIRQI